MSQNLSEKIKQISSTSRVHSKILFSSTVEDMISSVMEGLVFDHPMLTQISIFFVDEPKRFVYTLSFGNEETNSSPIIGFSFEDVRAAEKWITKNGLSFEYVSPKDGEPRFIEVRYNA